ncbi:type 1 fimbrial protein [Yersinia enterocolitica]|uniref:fimbrial protein n=1 Tax=Yersinia enterocolitica TaxID=630 RepID=UPI001C8DC535|nr:fimbrial protein [Yersinia enterocolitica]MBX9494673.1 type 1 fimbrial protein [Yersinia enterocolitica]
MNMTMKKKLIVTSLLAASVFASAANAATGKITITGSVTATPCEVAINNGTTGSTHSLTMPNIFGQDIPESASPINKEAPFEIKLTGCPKSAKNAEIKFTGTAKGADIELQDNGQTNDTIVLNILKSGSAYDIGTADTQAITSGNATFDYTLKYKTTKSRAAVKPGDLTAALDYEITYN